MQRNLRKELAAGRAIVGSWISSCSPVIAELMAGCDFDFLVVDVEHAAVDLPQTQQLFQAIRAGNPNCAPMVRLHGVDFALAKRYLDSGARGIIGPLVNSADEAKLLVEASKYPPRGRRGVGYCRANQYGRNLADSITTANDEILVAVQIEHIDGVNHLDQILSVPGIDAAFIGPYDLSASMGIAGDFENPEFLRVRERILSTCAEKGIVPGIHVVQPEPEALLQRLKEGFRFVAYSLDITMLNEACVNAIQVIRTRSYTNSR